MGACLFDGSIDLGERVQCRLVVHAELSPDLFAGRLPEADDVNVQGRDHLRADRPAVVEELLYARSSSVSTRLLRMNTVLFAGTFRGLSIPQTSIR